MTARGIIGKGVALAAGLAALSACAPLRAPEATPLPAPRPETPEAGAVQRSQASLALSSYYRRVENDLRAQGLLRTDGGGPDVPFSRRQLVENFLRIALFEEFSNVGGRMIAREAESRLHRWEQPIRMKVEFGETVPAAQRAEDRENITAFARRVSQVSGLPIRQVESNPNYHVFVLNEDERRRIGPRLRQIVPGLSQNAIETIQDIPRSTFCLVFAVDPRNDGVYSQAVAIIRGEHPDLLRLSCIHEEVAQGMGLSNDSPAARPSIFNDDEEFGLLTTHDEMLLKILYDRRLTPGMTVPEARPVVERIAAELMGGEA